MNETDRRALTVELCDRVFGDCPCKANMLPNYLHECCRTASWMADVVITNLPRSEAHVVELIAAGKGLHQQGQP